jgi:spermidine synthase
VKDNPRVLEPRQYAFLLAALFLAGGSSLVLEILGTRLISPYYGSSLYCWSALITVTLVSLAAGYNWGGRQAETASLALFCRLLAFAGGCTAVIPALRAPVLQATSSLGVQLGALSSATLLVAPALVLLSASGPVAVRLSSTSLTGVGRAAGDVYAVSTLGSVAGAILAGFVLIPHLALTTILEGTAALLLLVSAVGTWLAAKRVPYGRVAAATAALLFAFFARPGESENLTVNRETQYGQVKVLDYDSKRYLLVNGTTQSIATVDPKTGAFESDSPYVHALEWVAFARPGAKRALAIGLGGGLLPKALSEHYGLTVDAVELDPAMIELARSHFGYAPSGEVFAQDGRAWLARSGRKYPIVILDAFGAEAPPAHLFTREAFAQIRDALEPGGVLAINLVSLIRPPGDEPWLAVYKTLREVFPEVRPFIASPAYKGLANILYFCSDSPLDPRVPAKARPLVRSALELAFAGPLHADASRLDAAPVLTDDYAPLEALLARTSVVWRAALQENMGGVLLY